MRTNRFLLAVAVLGLVATACGDDSPEAGSTTAAPTTAPTSTTFPDPVIDPGDGGDYAPQIDPADFVAVVDNPYLPLTPGDHWSYEETDEEGTVENIEVEVLDETRDIGGITATVVKDTASVDGVVREDTRDWFAQDRDGNVWYLGEDTAAYDEQGQLEDREGSWEHGVDGALAGIAMPADPQVGDAYRQEFQPGTAEDMGQILEIGATVSVPFGDYENVVVTRDWSPIEPEVIEQKWYAPGIGVVRETTVRGDAAENVLVDASVAG